MTRVEAEPLSIDLDGRNRVSALLQAPLNARACYVFAHGAGAGMAHPFMAAFAQGLAARGVATLRYQFPYMEAKSKRPDVPEVAQATVRAAVAQAASHMPRLVLVAGGKSFGGRMTSQAQATKPLPFVRGLAFVGFPLHPAGSPSAARAEHLARIEVPMLFLQGTRDALAEWPLMQRTVAALDADATLVHFDDADHSFHVPRKSGRTDADVLEAMLDAFADWVGTLPSR